MDSMYIKPYNPLCDTRRDLCASTLYQNLPLEEQKKDDMLAVIFEKCIKVEI